MEYKELVKHHTHSIKDQKENEWKVIETSDLEEICEVYHQNKLKQLHKETKSFYWDEDTIDYFAELYSLNGWAHTAQRIFSFVLNECDIQDDETYQDLFNNLIVKVEDKVNKEEYEWIEVKLQEEETENDW